MSIDDSKNLNSINDLQLKIKQKDEKSTNDENKEIIMDKLNKTKKGEYSKNVLEKMD